MDLLGKEILRYRRRARISQATLAERLGTSERSVRRWEKGVLPQKRFVKALGPALGMTLSEREAFEKLANPLRARYVPPCRKWHGLQSDRVSGSLPPDGTA